MEEKEKAAISSLINSNNKKSKRVSYYVADDKSLSDWFKAMLRYGLFNLHGFRYLNRVVDVIDIDVEIERGNGRSR